MKSNLIYRTRALSNPSSYHSRKNTKSNELIFELTHGIAFDKRDSATMPTDGIIIRINNSLAGIGGTKRYLRNNIDVGKYYPLYDQVVLSLSASVGNIIGLGEDVNLHDRYFLGGDKLRGFASSGVGPRDSTTDDALGGEWIYHASSQVTFPLGLPEELGISGKLFTDLGSTGKLNSSGTSVNDTGSMRLSVGTGVIWVSPFGPIGIDFGSPLIKESFDKVEAVRVNFGTRF